MAIRVRNVQQASIRRPQEKTPVQTVGPGNIPQQFSKPQATHVVIAE
jgi:hypothetical protein